MNETKQDMYKPYDPKELLDNVNQSEYITFDPGQQHDLIITNPMNVESYKFDKKQILLQFTVLNDGGVPCAPPKTWQCRNPGLIKQMIEVVKRGNDTWRVVVKRGEQLGKGTSYTVMQIPMPGL